ncbi:aminotransferase class I/II-fold pyridoxal phosphate-dependent enzyme [Microbacterium sp. QXD-8]|uniref:Aminotransferase class I/II-fold pyridoxal phosphate-dependent enzyme n=1 Tax=Microbacterium psychrotolerans TaxID=3068321 RepID=A0ABU0Z2L8_9MICO|nr:aminotransferase class I/II-fold pyridoxal phosphate-dependent enzyme [Microbacterium sp. QXD-8]MDQ7878069.1 aminotransferase class I/II-fold pyridoxal phosphate-dependent enzyme [Microbacterium sp. QXD-8]
MASMTLHPDSLAVHAGRDDLAALGVHALPLDLSSTNPLPGIELGGMSYEVLATGGHPFEGGSNVYARLWNPTVARFEEALARLEHAEEAVAFSSGMAAVTAVLLALTHESQRRHVVAVRPLYGGTDHLLASGLLGVETTFCAPDAVAEAMRDDTALVVLETPANPTLELVDIRAVVAAAGDVPVLVDNTFATPVLQHPLDLGAALSLHSATKYLGGHGDVVGGVVACDARLAASLRRTRAITGAIMHPLSAYLLHRGLATLPVRMRAQQEGARVVAEWLTTRPEVARVHFPGFAASDPHGLVGTQQSGPGAMIAIDLTGGFDAASSLTAAVELFTHAVSLGSVDSLIQHPAALTHRPVASDAKPSDALVRLSIGLEDPADLIADLAQAFSATTGARGRVEPALA